MDTGCGIVTDQISSDILRNSSHNTDEYIADLSNFLLDVNDDDKLVYTRTDGNDHEMSDASSFDFRSFLLDTTVEDNRTDKGVSEISKAPDQQPMESSPLAVDPALTEMQGGVINCTLNTEELEVPNNDDIFLPVKTLSTSFALMAHKENVKTHHERNFLKKREQNSHVPSHISSSMTGHQPIERNYSGMKYQLEKLKRTINRIKWAPDARTQIRIAVLHGRHSRHFIRKTQAIIKIDAHGVFHLLNIGVKISANSAIYSSSQLSPSTTSSSTNTKNQDSTNKPLTLPIYGQEMEVGANDMGGNSLTSSISEYLEMLPGWHVEEFLNSSNIPANCFCKIGDNNDVFPTWNTEIESTLNSFSPESIGIWVPQAPTPQQNQTQIFPQNINFGRQIEFKNSKGGTSNKSRRKWRDDNSFAVPQINPSSSTSFKSQELFGSWI
ncbi:hypothetical protein RND71_027437 [Anisodus tanguticus]|uniref:Uncharacterized protein n=1 Tax=Anisodus tanguticus TaxID=243964 RepID=A0AAE1RIT1_9SOLA|nr:hypothetical protein RND71_027437 [Anisodus tanguticus]